MADQISSPSKNKYKLVLSIESQGQILLQDPVVQILLQDPVVQILLQDPVMQLPKGQSRTCYWEYVCHS